MTDREMLEMAARAAGYEVRPDGEGGLTITTGVGRCRNWNPREDDGDALRLAVKLQIQITPGVYNPEECTAYSSLGTEAHERVSYLQDPYAATRRAITRAAAEIGRREVKS